MTVRNTAEIGDAESALSTASAASDSERAHWLASNGGSCQRWRDRRTSYRPAGELFDPSRASVQPIDEATAKAFVVRHHYSGSYPAARFRAGVFLKDRFQHERLVGVGVYSVPMNQAVVPSYFPGLDPLHGAELGRFILLDEVPANAESWSIARMQRLLRVALPDVTGVLAYSDPLPRTNAAGVVTKVGHRGTIYKALNAVYSGRSAARTPWLAHSGATFADRMLSKVRLDERGSAYAQDRIESEGAPRRNLGESGVSWILRLKEQGFLRPMRHPGNLAFTWKLSAKPRPGRLTT